MAVNLKGIDLLFAQVTYRLLGGSGFGLISLASRSRIKIREVDRAGGIDIEDFMLKY